MAGPDSGHGRLRGCGQRLWMGPQGVLTMSEELDSLRSQPAEGATRHCLEQALTELQASALGGTPWDHLSLQASLPSPEPASQHDLPLQAGQ